MTGGLLDLAVAAHGGLERWAGVKTIDEGDYVRVPEPVLVAIDMHTITLSR